MTAPPALPPARVLGGALLLLACTQYFVCEAVAAGAWHDPAYSYLHNFISDLGVAGCGRVFDGRLLCSPLAWLMNTSFVLEGALVCGATLLLAPLLPGVWRPLATVLALTHAVGDMVVGLWPETAAGALPLHGIGAGMAILGGQFALMAAGVGASRAGAPRWVMAYSVVLGLLGLAGLAALFAPHGLPVGLSERVAVDVISAWKIGTGLVLAVALWRAPASVSGITLRTLGSGGTDQQATQL